MLRNRPSWSMNRPYWIGSCSEIGGTSAPALILSKSTGLTLQVQKRCLFSISLIRSIITRIKSCLVRSRQCFFKVLPIRSIVYWESSSPIHFSASGPHSDMTYDLRFCSLQPFPSCLATPCSLLRILPALCIFHRVCASPRSIRLDELAEDLQSLFVIGAPLQEEVYPIGPHFFGTICSVLMYLPSLSRQTTSIWLSAPCSNSLHLRSVLYPCLVLLLNEPLLNTHRTTALSCTCCSYLSSKVIHSSMISCRLVLVSCCEIFLLSLVA